MKPLTPLEEEVLKVLGISPEQFEKEAEEHASSTQTRQAINTLSEESLVNMMAIAEAYETSRLDTIKREEESVNSMMGLAEAYELIITLQGRIEALENK